MGPNYDAETLAGYFHAVDPALYADPLVGPVLRRLEAEDPDVIAAISEVDRSQIRESLARTPFQRLSSMLASWNTLARYRVGG